MLTVTLLCREYVPIINSLAALTIFREEKNYLTFWCLCHILNLLAKSIVGRIADGIIINEISFIIDIFQDDI